MAEPATAGIRDTDGILEMERLIAATPERVFDAFVNPEILAKWWGPERCTAEEISLDVREGGRWRTLILGPDGTRYPVSGAYRVIDRPDRLVMSWAWEEEDGSRGNESEVEISFTAAGSGTHLTLVHRNLGSAEAVASHRAGWQETLNDLERLMG